MKNLKQKSMNNKGFSLVELIIVIAIMAILVGIVGTQVLPYIEKSKIAKDQQVLSGVCTDAVTAFSTNADSLVAGGNYTLKITGTEISATTTPTGDTGAPKVIATMKELKNGTYAVKLTSKDGAGKDIIINYNGTTGQVTVEASGATKIPTVSSL